MRRIDHPTQSPRALDGSGPPAALDPGLPPVRVLDQVLDLYCPFPSEIFHDTEAAHLRTIEWGASFGLIDKLDSHNRVALEKYTWLAGRMFPSAGSEVFQLIADFTSWLFWHDDLCDESSMGSDPDRLAVQFRRQLALLVRREHPREVPLEAALCDLRDRFERLAPDAAWMLRFTCHLQEYFEACLWEAENRATGVTPPVGTYIPLRRCAGAVWVYLDFLDLVLRRSFPLAAREHPDVHRLREITCNVVAWHNDIYSLPKELRMGDVHNLVVVLRQENGGDLAEALQLATRYANAEVHAFQAIEAKLPRFGPSLDAILEVYIQALKVFVRGASDWAREALRYAEVYTEPLDLGRKRPRGRANAGA